ncbi:hypothetical protein BN874_130047 [Candidatus Contendobacter odensis Run_B_J11]|uniref:Uncharacterized protein n=1 Tax=Candidatus Contendobacter odensis Run_B_J11 TaxID=1400861 RepID=A0A7U7G874_9GAMM|nr:hypothetical protein BN874_130047 [Candidatus Contendobacter odensis Run_B_J11]
MTAGKDRHLTSKADRALHGSLYLPALKDGVSRGESDEKATEERFEPGDCGGDDDLTGGVCLQPNRCYRGLSG